MEKRMRTRYDYATNFEGSINCYVSDISACNKRGSLVPARVLSTFHDESLADATKQINSILEKTIKANKDKSKTLSILDTPKGLFLAWTGEGITSGHEDEDELCNRLGI